jgi:FkbM family methyltransferase
MRGRGAIFRLARRIGKVLVKAFEQAAQSRSMLKTGCELKVTDYADFPNRLIKAAKTPPDIEHELVRTFFGNRSKGTFVDVGANDPFKDSQSYHLEALGWRGLLIEPLPGYCDRLRQHRSSTVIQLACSSEANHKKLLPIHVAGVHSSLEADLIAIGAQSDNVIHVETRTLNSILADNRMEPGFDLLSIDVEGHEAELFKGFDIGRWRPKLVLLEDHVTNHSKHNHMVRGGYQLLLRTGLNSWYVPAADRYEFTARAKLEFVRKYWLGLLARKIRYRRH